MLWPTFEYKAGFPSTEPIADMIRAMSGHVQVNLAVQDAADEADARRILAARGVPLAHVHFFHIEHGDIWARDMGPSSRATPPATCASTTGTSTCGDTRSPRATSAPSRSPSTAPLPTPSTSRCSTPGPARRPACA